MRAPKGAYLGLFLMLVSGGALAGQRGVEGVRENPRRAVRPDSWGYSGLSTIVLRDSALDRFAERMELTEEQRGQLRAIAENYRSENADVLDRMERMREELGALRDRDEPPTRQELDEVVERYNHPDLDLTRADRSLHRDVNAILTPEQQISLLRSTRMSVLDRRSRLPSRRAVDLRGGRRVRDLVRRPSSRYRQAPISRIRRIRRLPRRPTRRP